MDHVKKGNGFSLVGLLMGVGILGVVVMGSGYLLSSAKTTEIRSDLQAEMDRSHLLAVQQTRSIAYLKKHLALYTDTSKNAGGGAFNNDLMTCLAKKGSGCNQRFGTGNSSPFQPIQSSRVETPCSTGSCKVESLIEYRGVCTATACNSIDIKFSSRYMGDKHAMKPRENIIRLSAALFADKGTVAFNCTNQRALASIDTENLEAVCTPPAPSSCGNAPLQGYNVCPALNAQNCGNGVRTVGIYNGQGVCR